MNERRNVRGQAYALTVLTPIRDGREPALRAYLEALPRAGASPLARLEATHLARWVIVDTLANARPGDDLPCPQLLFTSTFDGPLQPYLDALCARLGEVVDAVWGACAGYPGPVAERPDAVQRYLRDHQLETSLFFAPYGDATLPEVRRALDARERMRRFAIAAQGQPPAELRAAFRREFGP